MREELCVIFDFSPISYQYLTLGAAGTAASVLRLVS